MPYWAYPPCHKRALLALILLLWASAAAAFTDPTARDSCDRTENPLSNGGQWTGTIVPGETGVLAANGTTCVHSGSGDASAWWNAASFGPDVTMAATMPDATGTTGNVLFLFVRIQGPGTAGVDAYTCDFFPSNPLIRVSLWQDGVRSTLASSAAVDVNDGHKVGCEAIGADICAYADVGAGWVQATCASNSTITTAGRVGFRLSVATINADLIGFDTIGGAGAGRRAVAPIPLP